MDELRFQEITDQLDRIETKLNNMRTLVNELRAGLIIATLFLWWVLG